MFALEIRPKWFVLGLVAVLMLLGSCKPRGTPTELVQSPAASLTPVPSSTVVPTVTATCTLQPTLTATSIPESPTPAGPDLMSLPGISLENIAGLTQVASIELHEGDQVVWSPSGAAFAHIAPSGMNVFRLEAFSQPIPIRYQSQPYFSADGILMATRLENGDVQVWDLERGILQGEYNGLMGDVIHMAFSITNDLLAAVSINNQLLVWDLVSGDVTAVLEVPEFVIPITYTYDLLFSPDQTRLALFREGEVLLWDIAGNGEPRRLHWVPPPASPAHGPHQFSPDWSAVAWSDRGNILIMDSATGEPINEFERQVGAEFTFTRDWKSLLVIGYNDTAISVWDPFTAEALQLLEHPQSVYRFWLSPDEHYLASLTFEGRATLWNLATGDALAVLTNEEMGADWLIYSPQGDRLALLMSDGRISGWDIPNVEQMFTLESLSTRTYLFSPDGSLLVTVSRDGGLQIWDSFTGESLFALDHQVTEGIIRSSFALAGKLLALETDVELQFWGSE